MSSLALKLKINNSYDSEPSSGSGSSLCEQNDYNNAFEEENLHLANLLKPPSYSNEVTITTAVEGSPLPMFTANSLSNSDRKSLSAYKVRQLLYDIPLHSSQDSTFEGFSDSPFGKVQRRMYAQTSVKEEVKTELIVPSTGKITFPKFYDIIIEENSSNAMDIQLSDEVAPQRLLSGGGDDSAPIMLDDGNLAVELSFNGKFKNLAAVNELVNDDQPTSFAVTAPETVCEGAAEQQLNSSRLNDSFILKKYSNEKSPDLFGDDDDDETAVQVDDSSVQNSAVNHDDGEHISHSVNFPTESSFVDENTHDCATYTGGGETHKLFRENCRRDRELLRRIRKCLAGVPPPPSLTIPQIDLFNAVTSHKDKIFKFLSEPVVGCSPSSTTNNRRSLFTPTHTLEETKDMAWKDILAVRQHGLSFNLTKASESNEYLSLSVVERFIGAETASSYKNSPSSAKKRSIRMKLLTQSPGNRLSHLAKRRAIFSSANLATQKSSTLSGPQIVLDKKKAKHRRKATPKRKTPGSKKKARKTPSSSARKRLFRFDLIRPGPSRETSKRALFQSPAKQQEHKQVAAKPVVIKPEIATRVERSKRALFSPENQSQSAKSHPTLPLLTSLLSGSSTDCTPLIATATSPLESLLKRKRNPMDDVDDAVELAVQSSKLFRGSVENLTPRSLKIKSQSFCIGAGSSTCANTTATAKSAAMPRSKFGLSSSSQVIGSGSGNSSFPSSCSLSAKMPRALSDMYSGQSNGLTENQKKKLLWAVSQALQEKKITTKHESFKQYASVLARVVRRIFQEYYHKSSTSNSETMLRLAKKYVYNVISGKNADDIYFQAKSQIDDHKRQSCSRLSGYIGPDEYEQLKKDQQITAKSQIGSIGGSVQNIFASQNSNDSYSLISISQSSSIAFDGTAVSEVDISQSSYFQQISQDYLLTQNSTTSSKCATKHLPIQPNSALKKSTSKSNIGGLALRENVDCEQRRSAQKNFTGKDQRNVSPYAQRLGSGLKAATQLKEGGSERAKRQIIFDS